MTADLGSRLDFSHPLHCRPLQAVWPGGPLRNRGLYAPTYSVPPGRPALLQPGCQHSPSLPPAQEGWSLGARPQGLRTWELWGLDPGSALGPLILPPHSLFWSFCWRLCGDPLDVEGVYKAYSPRRIHRLAPELPQGLCMCCLCPLFSFSSTASPSATLWLHKHIFLCVTPVDGTISVSYSESFYCSPNLPCDEFLGLPAGAPDMRPLPRCWAGCLPRCGQGGWWLRGGDRGGREATAAAPPGGMVN